MTVYSVCRSQSAVRGHCPYRFQREGRIIAYLCVCTQCLLKCVQADQVCRQEEQEVPVADREAEAGTGGCAEEPAVPLRVLPRLPGGLPAAPAGQPAVSTAT